MKKIGMMFLLALVVLVGCGSNASTTEDGGTISSMTFTNAKNGPIQEVTLEEFMKMKEDSSFVLIIGQTTCSHCIAYQSEIHSAYDSNTTIYLFEIDKMGEGELAKYTKETDIVAALKDVFGLSDFQGTPTTVTYKNGKVTNFFAGNDIESLEKEIGK